MNLNMNNFIIIFCIFINFNLKLTTCQAYHISPATEDLRYHRYPHHYLQQPSENDGLQVKDNFMLRDSYVLSNDLSLNNEATHYAGHHNSLHHHRHHHYQVSPQQNYLDDLHLKQLAESAKDPKMLKNGIYHDGAVTYDLGSASYEVLNPYDPPEIITSDHPHYHHHLNYIKNSNNFTIEDFGVTAVPDVDKTSEAPSTSSPTTTDDDYEYIETTRVTTDVPETTTSIATLTRKLSTTPFAIQPNEDMINDSYKSSDRTKENLQNLKIRNNSISSSPLPNVKFILLRINNDLKKKLKSASLQSYDLKNLKNYPQQNQQQPKATGFSKQSPIETMPPEERFHVQSFPLPTDHLRSNYRNNLRNTLPQSVFSPPPTLPYHQSYLNEINIRSKRELVKADLGENK